MLMVNKLCADGEQTVVNVGCSSVGASTSLVNGEKPLVNTLVYKVCVQFPLELHR